MKKQIITLLALGGIALSITTVASKGNYVAALAESYSFAVTNAAFQSSESWAGCGVYLETGGSFDDKGNSLKLVYDSSVAKNEKFRLYDGNLDEQPVTLTSCGSQIIMNSQIDQSYYGYLLEVDAGFSFELGGNTYTVSSPSTFLAKTNTYGSYWTSYSSLPRVRITATKTSITLKEGQEEKLDAVCQVQGDSSPIVSYKSSDPTVASVDANGYVKALKEGTATVRVTCLKTTKDYTITVEKNEQAQTGIKVLTKEIKTYKGFEWDRTALRVISMYGEDDGATLDSSEYVVSGEYDLRTPGNYTLTVTSNGFTDTFTLVVEDLPAATIGDTKNYHYGNNSGWGDEFYIVTDLPDIRQYLNLKNEALAKVNEYVKINNQNNQLDLVKNLGGGRYEFWFKNKALRSGDVIELLSGMPIFQFSGTIDANHEPDLATGSFVPVAELKTNYKYVYNGTDWDVYIGEPETVTISCPEFVAVGEEVQMTWVVGPVGTYGTPTFSSSDETIARVDANGKIVGVSEGNAVITAKLGSITETFNLRVLPAKEVKGVKFVNCPNYFSVVKGTAVSEFKPALTKAQLLFADDTVGPEFDINPDSITVSSFDTSVEGEVEVAVVLNYGGKNYNSSIKVNVYDYYDQKISEVGIVDWFIYSTFLQLPNTCTNIANLTGGQAMIPGLYDNITYTRADGTIVPLEVIYQLGANIALFPEFLFNDDGTGKLDADNFNEYYLPGDMITVEAMTPVYKWTGDITETSSDNHAMGAGTGEIIVEGYIKDKLQYRYDGNVWGLYIQYQDIAIANDTVEVMIGQTKSAGATRVPSNATSGTFSYVSSDPSVATVTTGGVIKGISQGTCTITVTLSEEGRESKVGTITVNVVDGIKSLKVEGGLQVTQGTKELDLSKLDAKVVWASGKEEAADLSSATVSGYDPEKLGKQNVAIKVTIEGKELSAKIVVEVVAKKGCGGSILTTTGIIALVSTLGVVLVSKKKKEEK